jgi:hypothetical protein
MLGEQPQWYPVMAAARYLKVPVWDLMNEPLEWVHRAAAAMRAEAHAQEMHDKMHK